MEGDIRVCSDAVLHYFWCSFAVIFYFNLPYCGVKTLSGLRLLPPLGHGSR